MKERILYVINVILQIVLLYSWKQIHRKKVTRYKENYDETDVKNSLTIDYTSLFEITHKENYNKLNEDQQRQPLTAKRHAILAAPAVLAMQT